MGSPDFKLGALLAAGLHAHADACAEVVDRAQRELVVEKVLRRITVIICCAVFMY